MFKTLEESEICSLALDYFLFLFIYVFFFFLLNQEHLTYRAAVIIIVWTRNLAQIGSLLLAPHVLYIILGLVTID